MHRCDHCGKEATVHEVTVTNGVKTERHLCEVCAAQEGIGGQGPGVIVGGIPGAVGVPGAGMVMKMGVVGPAGGRAASCPNCGQTFEEFKQTGMLGCGRCYEAFEPRLAPMIERAQEGLRHIGKVPRRACNAEKGTTADVLSQLRERAERARRVRERMEEAVKAEQYEKAAVLRDELKRIESAADGGAPPGAGSAPGSGSAGVV